MSRVLLFISYNYLYYPKPRIIVPGQVLVALKCSPFSYHDYKVSMTHVFLWSDLFTLLILSRFTIFCIHINSPSWGLLRYDPVAKKSGSA